MSAPVLAACVLLLGACSSSGSPSPATHRTIPPVTHSAAHYATAAEAVAASCDAFDRFTVDLARETPHGNWGLLISDAQAVLAPLIHTDATLVGADRKLYNDATLFVMHMGRTDWPTKGTPIDRQILAVQDDCA